MRGLSGDFEVPFMSDEDAALYDEKIADGTISSSMSAADIARILGPIGDGIAQWVRAQEQRKTLQAFMPQVTVIALGALLVWALKK